MKVIIKIFNKLFVIGDNIDDEDRVAYLLVNFPDSYEMLSTALEENKLPNMETEIE